MKYIIICILISGLSHVFAQWESDVRLTNDPAISATSYGNAWCVAATGDTVHVVWYDYRDGGSPYGEIYYKRSTDGGATWGADTRLTIDDSTSHFPSVATSGAYVHLVWEETRDGNSEIYHKRSTDGGLIWEADTRLTNDTASSGNPSLAVSGSYVHTVWDDTRGGNSDVYYKRSTDGGTIWGADIALTGLHTSGLPSVAVFGANVHTVWNDGRHGDMEIYYRRSTDNGATWEPEIRLTNEPSQQTFPCIAVYGSIIHVVWGDMRDAPNIEIYYKRSIDNGMTWDPDTRLTISPNSFYPSLAASGPNVHLTWRDVRGTPRIYYKVSTDSGTTWSPDTALPSANVIQLYPSIAASGAIVHVVWWDQRDGPSGNVEVYYKRNPTGNPGVEETVNSKFQISKLNFCTNPNPFVDYITVRDYEKEVFVVYDVAGEVVGSYRGNRIGSDLVPGIYFLRLLADDSKLIRVVKVE